MIVPNLMVTDVKKSVAFYRDVIGMEVMIYVDEGQKVYSEDELGEVIPVFATLQWHGQQLMMQVAASLSEDVPEASQAQDPTFTGTLYFRDHTSPDEVLTRCQQKDIIKKPMVAWYGMRELYLKDPDGYVVCVATRAS